MKLSSKLPDVGTSIFTQMSVLAAQYQAVNLGQGFPGFACDPLLPRLAYEHMQAGHNQYAPMAGLPQLRQETARLTAAYMGYSYDADTEVTITSGATEALYAVISAVVQPEDEVIVFDPCYDSYVPAILANGGQPVHIPLTYPGYAIDWDKVKRLVTSKTRALLLNSPHNPSGRMLTEADIKALKSITRDSNLLIISDEVYAHIVFDGRPHLSVASDPELAMRSFVIGSYGKTLHLTGWKVGYVLAPAALSAELRKFHQYITFCTSTPLQHAIADYLAQKPNLVQDLQDLYTAKRNLFIRLMANSRFEGIPVQGSYFQLYHYGKISDAPDTEFCKWLIEKHGVAAIPTSVFYRDKTDHKVVRFCFAKTDEELQLAAERLCKI
ncbi:MAG: aminotransferase class I/II-fold pyridoxal phosphate-dependent enzyme [Bacteroidetes bacterium]|nr:aminotransferase class I/II-fold pyridoxal phosphate-dependent enzyme [Bacteroidota bacterium]